MPTTLEPPEAPPRKQPKRDAGAEILIQPQRTSRRRLLMDRFGRWMVTAGGMGIIISILSILAYILIEVWPLTKPAEVVAEAPVPLATEPLMAVLTDEYRTLAVGVTPLGVVRTVRLEDGSVVDEKPLLEAPARVVAAQAAPGHPVLGFSTNDGRVIAVSINWSTTFEGSVRSIAVEVGAPATFVMDPAGGTVDVFAVSLNETGGAAAGVLADGSLALVRREATENMMTGEKTEEFKRETAALERRPTHLLIDNDLRNMYGGTADGTLLWWTLSRFEDGPQPAAAGDQPVTAMTLLIGHRSLVVGQADGTISIWFPVRQSGNAFLLTQIRTLPPLDGPVVSFSPSMRSKGFIAVSATEAGIYQSTSERMVWRGAIDIENPLAVTLAPRGDGALVAGADRLGAMAIHNPHPEVTLKSLFGRVWYEGYEKPEYVWQSGGGSDDFEPKLSLTPLLFGTMKGTVFSLLLAIPLGVLGAMYVSQFMHPKYQRVVKPTVEIMAALPTVVLGFLAGLWLAPKVQGAFPALILMVFAVPAVVLATGSLWHQLPLRVRGKFSGGTEMFLFLITIALAIWGCLALSPAFERIAFGGNFSTWLRETTGWTYDQRNAVVVGLAMGFAVIPIIFAISEDAFSNVPRNLVSGSLALGANRWQTVTRVVLPTASPGIFSAIMIGFGRAIGETMIVLMATGNTPIMDWSPFNGFRTLSANIAVEIPEAPHGGTLYRTLFLAALLLFVLTFMVNTVAELIRLRLRQKYSKL